MCRKGAEDSQLCRGEPVVLSSPDPLFQTPQPFGKGAGIGISVQRVARHLREFNGADRVTEVEAEVAAAQREIGRGRELRKDQSADRPLV